MRRWLILIVIALLPLRLWASGVMSLQMAAEDVSGSAAVHASAHVSSSHAVFSHAASTAAGSGCSLHADVGPQAGDSSADECKICDLCAPLIETSSYSASVMPMQSAASAVPSSATSILPDSAFKPPRLLLLLS